jgi:hypothetical protein
MLSHCFHCIVLLIDLWCIEKTLVFQGVRKGCANTHRTCMHNTLIVHSCTPHLITLAHPICIALCIAPRSCLHMPSHAFTCLHMPSHAFTCLHMSSPIMPSHVFTDHAFTCFTDHAFTLHMMPSPMPSHVFTDHAFTFTDHAFTCLHRSCLHMSSPIMPSHVFTDHAFTCLHRSCLHMSSPIMPSHVFTCLHICIALCSTPLPSLVHHQV